MSIGAGTKLRFRGEDDGILTGLADGPPDAGNVTITTLEDPPRTFTRPERQVVVIGDESVFRCGGLP